MYKQVKIGCVGVKSEFFEGMEKGMEKGRKEGMELQAKKIALSLIDKMSLGAIVESTGLSVVVVKELKRLFDKYGDKAVEHLDN